MRIVLNENTHVVGWRISLNHAKVPNVYFILVCIVSFPIFGPTRNKSESGLTKRFSWKELWVALIESRFIWRWHSRYVDMLCVTSGQSDPRDRLFKDVNRERRSTVLSKDSFSLFQLPEEPVSRPISVCGIKPRGLFQKKENMENMFLSLCELLHKQSQGEKLQRLFLCNQYGLLIPHLCWLKVFHREPVWGSVAGL